MELTLAQAGRMLERRNRCFMTADMVDYLAMWTDDCVVEVLVPSEDGTPPTSVALDKTALENTVASVWAEREVVHMETRSFAVNRAQILNEFSIVWRNRSDGTRALQTGIGVVEVAEDGRWRSLRDHYDATGGAMQSATQSPEVERSLRG